MERPRSTLLTGVALLLLTGCTLPSDQATGPHRSAVASTPATPGASASGASGASPCSAPAMAALVRTFVRAANAGDQAMLSRLWATTAQGFMWYSVGAPQASPDPRDRDRLMAYFSARHRRHERLRITSMHYNGTSGATGDFQFTVTRTADDIARRTLTGKGSAFCRPGPGQLFVWAMTPS